jgi:hypothetical protein
MSARRSPHIEKRKGFFLGCEGEYERSYGQFLGQLSEYRRLPNHIDSVPINDTEKRLRNGKVQIGSFASYRGCACGIMVAYAQ